jgi:hypothetical protein
MKSVVTNALMMSSASIEIIAETKLSIAFRQTNPRWLYE